MNGGTKNTRRWNRRPGFTLIEVILALGLTALVLVALAAAVDVHLRVVQTGRTHVEEAQLARALLDHIADDLRDAVIVNPVEAGPLQAPAGGSSGTGSASQPPGGPSAPGATPPEDDTSAAEQDDSQTETDLAVAGLVGESDWLQVDVMRLPRLDQYDEETIALGDGSLSDRLSATRRVVYYLNEETGNVDSAGDEEYRGGLVRRELDRTVSAWDEERGLLADLDDQWKPIAPEVTAIEFLYFDGTEWVESWDSNESGGLPVAVHVSLVVTREENLGKFSVLLDSGDAGPIDPSVSFLYSLTVALPVAEPSEATAEGTAGESGQTTGSSGGSSSAGTGGGSKSGGGAAPSTSGGISGSGISGSGSPLGGSRP